MTVKGMFRSNFFIFDLTRERTKGIDASRVRTPSFLAVARPRRSEPLTDKRRKRRESHNAVERRRRDNINDRIAELASLLPEAFQVGAPQPPPPLSASSSTRDEPNGGPGSPAIGSLSLMSPGPFGSGSPTSFHSVSGAAYMAAAAAAAASSSAQQQKATTTGLSAQAQAAAQKPNKGAVLAKSVDYIRSVFFALFFLCFPPGFADEEAADARSGTFLAL